MAIPQEGEWVPTDGGTVQVGYLRVFKANMYVLVQNVSDGAVAPANPGISQAHSQFVRRP